MKNGGNLCYKLDFAGATPFQDTQASSKVESKGVGTRFMFNAAFSCKGPHPCSGANKTLPSSLGVNGAINQAKTL